MGEKMKKIVLIALTIGRAGINHAFAQSGDADR
jgi:hypothetical protein